MRETTTTRTATGVRIAGAVLLATFLGGGCRKAHKPGSPALGVVATGGADGAGGTAGPGDTESPEARAAAERELAEQMDLVRGTGPATPAVEKSFASVLSQLRVRLQSSTHAQFLDGRCFRGGCTFVLQFPRQVAYEAIDSALVQDEAFATWPGGKFRSGVFRPDSKSAQVTWMLFLDDATNNR